MKRQTIITIGEAARVIAKFDFSCFSIDTESEEKNALDYCKQKLIRCLQYVLLNQCGLS